LVKGFIFGWKGKGFGNALIASHVTKIVNDCGVPAAMSPHRTIVGLVDVPIYDSTKHEGFSDLRGLVFSHTFAHKRMDLPILEKYLRYASECCGQKIEFSRKDHNFVPVTFTEVEVPKADVALNTTSGPWGPNRNWPYFTELKKMLESNGISYIDLNEERIVSHTCLNYVKKAKLYIGLDTGMSHYVSKFANHKALILQSGHSPFWFWAYPYEYDFITSDNECEYRPCLLNVSDTKVCPYDRICMTSLSKEVVFKEILRRI